jgi:hypothetical protein
VLLVLFAFVLAYQLRSSLDTVHLERSYEFYLPFVLQPFTNRIAHLDSLRIWEAANQRDQRPVLHRQDEVLSVNEQPLRGVSTYFRELWKSMHQPPDAEWRPFVVTARSTNGAIHRVEVGFPHCTCGIPSCFDAAATWIVPPVFCVLLGFATVFLRPKAMLAWAFLGLMLSLSQVQFWSDSNTGFQLTATPMVWAGWFRVFAVGYRALVQYAWPAGLLLASAHFYRSQRKPYGLAMGLAALFFVHAMVQAALQIAWSEDYRPFVFLYRFLQNHGTELIVTSVAAVAILAWLVDRMLGLAAVAAGLPAAIALYRGAAPITAGDWVNYSDGSHRFVASVPAFHSTPSLIAMLFTAGVLAAALMVFKRGVTAAEALGFLLCVPLGADFAARWGAYWYPLESGFFRYWVWFAMAFAGVGLLCISRSVLRRTAVP